MANHNLASTDAGRGYRNLAGTPYSIDITMSAATVEALSESNYRLFLFKAVASAVGGGAPTVWGATSNYSTSTQIDWTEEYYAYASTEEVQNGLNFYGSDSAQIDLGQTLDVANNAIVSVVDGGASPTGITIANTTHTPFSCGLAQPNPLGGQSSPPSPICAFPLYGGNQDLLIPLEQVALVFAAGPYQQGTVIESSIGPAVLADLTYTTSVSLNYDINNGWSWSGTVASDIPPNAFVQTLIVPSPPSGSSAGGSGTPNADPVRSVSIWSASRANPLRPLNMIATGSGQGYTNGNSLADTLTVSPGAEVKLGHRYIANYLTQDNRPEAWQVECTYVPASPDNPYDFTKIQKADGN